MIVCTRFTSIGNPFEIKQSPTCRTKFTKNSTLVDIAIVIALFFLLSFVSIEIQKTTWINNKFLIIFHHIKINWKTCAPCCNLWQLQQQKHQLLKTREVSDWKTDILALFSTSFILLNQCSHEIKFKFLFFSLANVVYNIIHFCVGICIGHTSICNFSMRKHFLSFFFECMHWIAIKY